MIVFEKLFFIYFVVTYKKVINLGSSNDSIDCINSIDVFARYNRYRKYNFYGYYFSIISFGLFSAKLIGREMITNRGKKVEKIFKVFDKRVIFFLLKTYKTVERDVIINLKLIKKFFYSLSFAGTLLK